VQAGGAGGRAQGPRLGVWSRSPEPAAGELPEWCSWRPLPEEARVRTRARALVRPRSDTEGAAWDVPADAIAIADDVPSFAAVSTHRHSVATLHYRTSIDAAALHRRALRDVQDRRAERRAAAGAWLTL